MDQNNKLILAQGLQRDYLGKLVHAVMNHGRTEGYDPDSYIFHCLFGKPINEFADEIEKAGKQFHDLLRKYDVNVIDSRRLTAMDIPRQHRKEFIGELEHMRLGYHYGRAAVLSTSERGKFILYKNGESMVQGIDISFTRGLKNEYDQHFLEEFLRIIFEEKDYEAAARLFQQTVEDVRQGAVNPSTLEYITKQNRREYDEYSASALKNRTVLQKVMKGVKKGERFSWGYQREGACDYGMYFKVMFGEEKNGRWSFTKYTYQKSSKKSRAKTTCGGIVEAALVYNSPSRNDQKLKRKALERIVRGRTLGDEIKILGNV